MGRKEKQLTTLVRKWERGLNWGENASDQLCLVTFHLWSGSAIEGGSRARKESCVELTKDVIQPGSLQPSNSSQLKVRERGWLWSREETYEGECGWKIKSHMQTTTSNIWHGGWVDTAVTCDVTTLLHDSLQLVSYWLVDCWMNWTCSRCTHAIAAWQQAWCKRISTRTWKRV